MGRHVPGNDETAGKRRTSKTRKGSKWLSQTLVECAKSANRSKDTYLAAQYARLRARRGANKATIAVCHSILTAAWHMLTTGETYTDPGGDYFARRDPERTRKRLVGQLERLGYTVTLQEGAAAALARFSLQRYRNSPRLGACFASRGGA
jgi:transposase